MTSTTRSSLRKFLFFIIIFIGPISIVGDALCQTADGLNPSSDKNRLGKIFTLDANKIQNNCGEIQFRKIIEIWEFAEKLADPLAAKKCINNEITELLTTNARLEKVRESTVLKSDSADTAIRVDFNRKNKYFLASGACMVRAVFAMNEPILAEREKKMQKIRNSMFKDLEALWLHHDVIDINGIHTNITKNLYNESTLAKIINQYLVEEHKLFGRRLNSIFSNRDAVIENKKKNMTYEQELNGGEYFLDAASENSKNSLRLLYRFPVSGCPEEK